MDKQKKYSQIELVFYTLKKRPMTTKMLQEALDIPREHLTRYIRTLEKQGKVVTVKTAPCKLTRHKAKYYSTDEQYFSGETQGALFPTTTKNRTYLQ